jgi:hypothetical protein
MMVVSRSLFYRSVLLPALRINETALKDPFRLTARVATQAQYGMAPWHRIQPGIYAFRLTI